VPRVSSLCLAAVIIAAVPAEPALPSSSIGFPPGVAYAQGAAAAGPAGAMCTGLARVAGLPNAAAVVLTAALAPPSEARPAAGPFAPPTPALPAHCHVTGRIAERTGAMGQRYAINFRLRMPTAWNGRFFFEGGGGSNGSIGNAYGNLQGQQPGAALALGFAVVSQDSGHDNQTNNDPQRGGPQTFGFDPQARIDFGHNSYDQVATVAKAIVAKYYGRPPERSYFAGCSEGGREGMMLSQRYPSQFDGILACSPGFNLPRAAVAEAWDSQAFADVARKNQLVDPNRQPFVNRTFTDEDLSLVSRAVLEACDAMDGAVDGMVQNFLACTTSAVSPKLSAITCRGAKSDTCLSQAQVAALKKVFDGARTSKGEAVYAAWAWDAGIGGKAGNAYNMGWRVWKLGAYGAPQNAAINLTLGASALPSIFVTPPVAVPTTAGGAAAYALAFDVNQYLAGLDNRSGEFEQSSLEFMKANSTDLSTFRSRGGKLVIAHGVSDPVFSILDTISWWISLNKANDGRAAEFVRLFAVPGMNHCAGGPATDQFDAFGALVTWVEKGVAPDQIVATAGAATPWPGRTRPLCAYPAQARFRGVGNLEAADSFVCQPPSPTR
jgi:feruloyl esterase